MHRLVRTCNKLASSYKLAIHTWPGQSKFHFPTALLESKTHYSIQFLNKWEMICNKKQMKTGLDWKKLSQILRHNSPSFILVQNSPSVRKLLCVCILIVSISIINRGRSELNYKKDDVKFSLWIKFAPTIGLNSTMQFWSILPLFWVVGIFCSELY